MSSSEILDKITGWLEEKDFLVTRFNDMIQVEPKNNENSLGISVPAIRITFSKDYENSLALGFQYDIDDDTHRAYIYLVEDEKVRFVQRIESTFKNFNVAAQFIPDAGTMKSLRVLNVVDISTLEKNSFLKTILDFYAVFTNVIISLLELNKTGKYFAPSKST